MWIPVYIEMNPHFKVIHIQYSDYLIWNKQKLYFHLILTKKKLERKPKIWIHACLSLYRQESQILNVLLLSLSNQVFQWKALVIKMMNVSWRISFPEHNSATVTNILMVHGRIIEQVNVDCRCKNDNSVHLGFLITSPYPYLFLVSGLYISNHLKHFNDTL